MARDSPMHERDDAPPGVALCFAHIPVQPGVMRPSGDTQVISVNTRPAPPMARAPRCTRCKSFGTPSTALYCAIGETTTRFSSRMPRSLNGRNIGRTAAAVPSRAATERPLDRGHEARIAQAQVLVTDALAAGQQAVGELLGLEVRVARDVLEPLHGVAGGVLQLQHLERRSAW